MNQLKEMLKEQYQIEAEQLKDAIVQLNERNIDPLPLLSSLDLDDYLDFLDEFFTIDNVYFEDAAVQALFGNLERSTEFFLELCKQEERDPTEADAEDFLAPDYAAVAQCASELCLNQYLTDGAASLLYEALLAYKDTKQYAQGFWLRFAYNYIIRACKLNEQAEIEVLLSQFAGLALQITSSHHLQFCVALCAFQHEQEEEAITTIVHCTAKSRDWLLSACAAILEARQDGLMVNCLLAHSVLGEGQKISSGLLRLVRELGYPEGEDDCGPAVFSQFLIYCIQDLRVARIVVESNVLYDWLDALMQEGDQRKQELVRSVGRAILRKVDGAFDNKARLMKIMNGQATNIGTSVKIEAKP